MLYGILFLLINIEYISFYYVFWGKRANIKYDWKMLVTLCISVLLLVLSIGIGNLDILCDHKWRADQLTNISSKSIRDHKAGACKFPIAVNT